MTIKVHVVEDEKTLLDAAAFYLKDAGFEVTESNDGSKAYDEIITSQPNVLLLDLALPGMFGLDLLRKLRDGGFTKPAIIMSNLNRQEIDVTDEELTQLNVHDVFLKSRTNFSDLPAAILGAQQKDYALET